MEAVRYGILFCERIDVVSHGSEEVPASERRYVFLQSVGYLSPLRCRQSNRKCPSQIPELTTRLKRRLETLFLTTYK